MEKILFQIGSKVLKFSTSKHPVQLFDHYLIFLKQTTSSHLCCGCGLVAKSCPTLATPQTVSHQVPSSTGFSSQEYWSGLSFPLPGDLLEPGIEPGYPALQADSLMTERPGKPQCYLQQIISLNAGNSTTYHRTYFPLVLV